MPHNENSRVKIPALVHFTRLGYKYISLRKYEGVIDDDTNILVDVLCDAINRINATSLTTTDTTRIGLLCCMISFALRTTGQTEIPI